MIIVGIPPLPWILLLSIQHRTPPPSDPPEPDPLHLSDPPKGSRTGDGRAGASHEDVEVRGSVQVVQQPARLRAAGLVPEHG